MADTATFSVQAPVELFRDSGFVWFGSHAISPDGQRFLLFYDGRSALETSGVEVVIVQNWHQELLERVPTN